MKGSAENGLPERREVRRSDLGRASRNGKNGFEDFLARRTRALLLDARASVEMAPRVAELMGQELRRDQNWVRRQANAYRALARGYLVT